MASQETGSADAPLTLRLCSGSSRGHDIFQRNQSTFSRSNNLEVITFDSKNSHTLVCTGYDGAAEGIDLAEALCGNLLQLTDEESGAKIEFPASEKPAARLNIPPKPTPQHAQTRKSILVDSTAQIWKDTLKPGKTYAVRFSASAGEVWCFQEGEAENKLPVTRDLDSVIKFKVYDAPAPPRFHVSIRTEPETCHLSGDPPFKFAVTVRSTIDQPVTIEKFGSPYGGFLPFGVLNSLDQLIECVDEETGAEVEWGVAFGCFDSSPMPDPLPEDQYIEIGPRGQWTVEHYVGGEKSSNNSSLDDLAPGRSYIVNLSSEAKHGFTRWRYGTKDQTLGGTKEERKARWSHRDSEDALGVIGIECGEPARFKTVSK